MDIWNVYEAQARLAKERSLIRGHFHTMKVLHVIPSVGLQRGGPSVMVRTLAPGLVQAGLEVHVATTDDNGRERLHVPHGIPVVEEGVAYWYFRRQTHFYTFSWPLSRWLAQHVQDYDLVHIHALFSYAAIPAAFWASRHGIPYIVRPLGVLNRWGMQNRHPWLKKLSFRLIEKRILDGAAAIHYTSEQERLEAMEGGTRQKSVVIPNAVGIAANSCNGMAGRFRTRYPQLADRTVILFLSRLDPKKGLDLLLPAFAGVRIRYPQVALVLAGSGDPAFVMRLQKEAVRLGINQDILWAGFLTGEEKEAALADADVFILPSYSENFGIAVVEAMAAGLPVVISNQVGLSQEVGQAEAGFVVSLDSKEITTALEHLLADDCLRQEMGRKGTDLVRKEFTWEKAIEDMLQTYEYITKGGATTSINALVFRK